MCDNERFRELILHFHNTEELKRDYKKRKKVRIDDDVSHYFGGKNLGAQ